MNKHIKVGPNEIEVIPDYYFLTPESTIGTPGTKGIQIPQSKMSDRMMSDIMDLHNKCNNPEVVHQLLDNKEQLWVSIPDLDFDQMIKQFTIH
tara:strand:- start:43 stop:321 length:279 start_codon:yes stop_codon:yes gene_type:complete